MGVPQPARKTVRRQIGVFQYPQHNANLGMNGIELGIELLLDNLELTQPYRKNTEVAPGEYDQRDGFFRPSGNVEQQLERGQQRLYPDRHRRHTASLRRVECVQ